MSFEVKPVVCILMAGGTVREEHAYPFRKHLRLSQMFLLNTTSETIKEEGFLKSLFWAFYEMIARVSNPSLNFRNQILL